MALEFSKKKEIRTRYCLSTGIMESIADHVKPLILENLGLNELKVANEKVYNKEVKKALLSIEDKSTEDTLERIESEPTITDQLVPVEMITDFYYRQKFKDEGLKKFREFAKSWRPSHVTYRGSRDTLDDIIKYARSTKI